MVFPGSPVDSPQSGQRQMMALWAALAPLQPPAPESIAPAPQFLPRLELRETADSCIVTVIMPGYDMACLEVQATANSLIIASRQASDRSTAPGSTPFRQTLALPAVQPSQLQVALQGEIMVVTLPKVRARQGWPQRLPRSRQPHR